MEIEKRKPGRPRISKKLTPALIKDICNGLREGLNHKTACAMAAVSPAAFYAWMAKGRETGHGLQKDLVEQVELAEEEAKATHLAFIKEIAAGGRRIEKRTERRDAEGNLLGYTLTTEELPPSLQASIWLLERRHPEEFGPKNLLDVSDGQNPFNVTLFGQVLVGSSEPKLMDEVPEALDD